MIRERPIPSVQGSKYAWNIGARKVRQLWSCSLRPNRVPSDRNPQSRLRHSATFPAA